MSFFHKKMSQNVWATIMPFGPVTIIFYWPSFQSLIIIKHQGTCTLITTLEMNCRFTLAYGRTHQESLIKFNILVDFGILNFDIADMTCPEIEI